jgi:hypothetical protein
MSIAAEAEHRQADDALPLPELVNRAGTLQGMLEKGYHPHDNFNHNNFNSASSTSKGGYDFDGKDTVTPAPWERGPRDRASSIGTGTGLLARTRKGNPGNDGTQVQTSTALDSPKIKRVPMTKKRRRIAIGCTAVLLVALILGIGLGTGLAKKKQKLPNCPGNFTGHACNLGE